MARRTVDARGSFCPGPLMELIAAMKMVAVGDELEVLSTDKGSASEIPEWLRKARHEHLGTEEKDGVWHVLVRKAR
ncbi:MAG: sulfurtransferase TusA family protein [Betaproteobacteria bacterium]|jgi:tRNA 2-thiouridine synthesizing protein A|nr:MAG: sulfurtransferase TusA family protein [Betaproteobacteria bacterium]